MCNVRTGGSSVSRPFLLIKRMGLETTLLPLVRAEVKFHGKFLGKFSFDNACCFSTEVEKLILFSLKNIFIKGDQTNETHH